MVERVVGDGGLGLGYLDRGLILLGRRDAHLLLRAIIDQLFQLFPCLILLLHKCVKLIRATYIAHNLRTGTFLHRIIDTRSSVHVSSRIDGATAVVNAHQ